MADAGTDGIRAESRDESMAIVKLIDLLRGSNQDMPGGAMAQGVHLG